MILKNVKNVKQFIGDVFNCANLKNLIGNELWNYCQGYNTKRPLCKVGLSPAFKKAPS